MKDGLPDEVLERKAKEHKVTFLLGSALRKLAAGPGAGVLLYMPAEKNCAESKKQRKSV